LWLLFLVVDTFLMFVKGTVHIADAGADAVQVAALVVEATGVEVGVAIVYFKCGHVVVGGC
jgi:hypothetical protein